ncbi:MAG: right-handed parallel beta-helix repeat-containing protein [Lachnospiraceae bacterium]|nr:right-handed parallel beta-helix repeat-containing protein [Lachnospiraceae bacterium]
MAACFCMCLLGRSNLQAQAATYTTIQVTASSLASDPSTAIQDALDQAKEKATSSNPYKVVVPSGTYQLTKSLYIYSNTYLSLSGVTLKQTNLETNMIRVGKSDDGTTGYAYENITIEGGTLEGNQSGSTLLKVAHASNFTLKNCTVQNTLDAHLMEVAGVKGLTITGCTFKNQPVTASASAGEGDSATVCYEAIQLDILIEEHLVGYVSEPLNCQDVVISGCTFKNVPRGVGSHTAVLNNPMTGIQIQNCTFSSCESVAIQGMNWEDCTITGNTITGCPRGIALYSVRTDGTYLSTTLAAEGGTSTSISTAYKTPADDQKIVISDNTITVSGTDSLSDYERVGILVSGLNLTKKSTPSSAAAGDSLPKGDYYISGVTITGNTVNTKGHGIRLVDVRQTQVDSNVVTYQGSSLKNDNYYGIQLREGAACTSVSSNTITNAESHGIYLNTASTVKNMKKNKVVSAGDDGIRIEDSGTVVTTMSSNTITSAGNNGIFLNTGSKVTTISSNTIKSSASHGINVGKAKVTSVIKGNTVSKAGVHAIYLHAGANVKNITSNTLTSPKRDGIRIEASSTKVTGSVKSNTITTPKVNGIYVYTKATVKTIESNKIKTAGKYGIVVENATVTTLTKNTISSATVNAIFVYNSGKVTTISSNKLSSPGKYGISVDKKSTATTIKSNTITSPKNHGIFVQNSSKIKTIKNNTIKSGKKRGISINCIKCNMTISGNTITKCKDSLIVLYPASASYTITVKNNVLTGTSSVNGIVSSKAAKVSISGNTIKNCKIAISLGSSVKSTIGKNTFSGNKSKGV